MNLTLLFPLGLLALAACVLPLLIHLARRHHYLPLEFAALRWLRAKARPRQRIRFDEWPLLLVRLLLLAALAVLLARPLLHGAAPAATTVVAVAPGLDLAAQRAQQPDADWRWLAPGFPSWEHPAPTGAQPLASLLRELDQRLPANAALSVYVPDPLPGLDAQRPRLSRTVHWHAVPRAMPAAQAPRPGAVQLQIGGGEAAPGTVHVLAALQRAWNGQPLAAPRTDATPPADGQIGVWLSPAALPAAWQQWLAQGGTVLATQPGSSTDLAWSVLLRDADDAPVLEQRRVGQGRLLRLRAPLSPAQLPALREADFPRRLLAVLDPGTAPQLAAAATQVPLTGAAAPAPQPRELAPWLLLAIVLLFALERWLATAPRRGAGA